MSNKEKKKTRPRVKLNAVKHRKHTHKPGKKKVLFFVVGPEYKMRGSLRLFRFSRRRPDAKMRQRRATAGILTGSTIKRKLIEGAQEDVTSEGRNEKHKSPSVEASVDYKTIFMGDIACMEEGFIILTGACETHLGISYLRICPSPLRRKSGRGGWANSPISVEIAASDPFSRQ